MNIRVHNDSENILSLSISNAQKNFLGYSACKFRSQLFLKNLVSVFGLFEDISFQILKKLPDMITELTFEMFLVQILSLR